MERKGRILRKIEELEAESAALVREDGQLLWVLWAAVSREGVGGGRCRHPPCPQLARRSHPAGAGRRDVPAVGGEGASVDALSTGSSAPEPDGRGPGGVWAASRAHALCHTLAA